MCLGDVWVQRDIQQGSCILWRRGCDWQSVLYKYVVIVQIWQEYSFNNESTASNLLSEVKHHQASLVLRWGATVESWVMFFLSNSYLRTQLPNHQMFIYLSTDLYTAVDTLLFPKTKFKIVIKYLCIAFQLLVCFLFLESVKRIRNLLLTRLFKFTSTRIKLPVFFSNFISP